MTRKNKQRTDVPPPPLRRGGHGPGRFGPVQKPHDFKGTLKRILTFFGEEKQKLWLVFLLVLVSAAISLFVPFWIGKTVDLLAEEAQNLRMLTVFSIILASVYITDTIFQISQGFIMAGISQRVVKGLRKALFSKFTKLPIAYFDRHTHGDLMSRVTNDIDNVSASISQSTAQLMSGVITITGSLVMMLVLSPKLTLAACITVPFMFVLTKGIAKRTRVLFRTQQKQLGRLNGHIEETISGGMVVKAFNRQKHVIGTFESINAELLESGRKAQIWSGLLMPMMNVINNLGIVAVAIVGGILAVRGEVSVGIIASFVSYSRQFTRPLNDLANIFNTFQSAVAGAERVFHVLDETEEADQGKAIDRMEHVKGDVAFENVSFGYTPGKEVIKHLNFHASPGSTIALVGPTGAGKTTIVNLLTRFYEVTDGRILIDGVDIRQYPRNDLRSQFGMVLQDTYLFTGTIKDNLKYGKLDASDEEMIAAAKAANAHTFIMALQKGYDTRLSESGSNLSQGQRQLLAIARAVLSNPTILILDEATSSVDTRTEMAIQHAMKKLMNGRTSFIIAHRLSTIREADMIMVIEDGNIIEMGSHEKLMQKKGRYQQMYSSQFYTNET